MLKIAYFHHSLSLSSVVLVMDLRFTFFYRKTSVSVANV